ncbi:hypothetical protein [Mycolicibacterium gilvum]|uniref:hypothetical protein n=1 Tax=Mycolicibacterium gilvum TaxID=1804 RepID=UPI004045DE4D
MNPDLLRGTLYGSSIILAAWTIFAAFYVPWYLILLAIAAAFFIAAEIIGALTPDPYRDTVFGREPEAVVHRLDDYRGVWPNSAGAVE